MRSSYLAWLGCFALAGCGEASAESETETATAAATAAAETSDAADATRTKCLVPRNHPRNFEGPIWTVDATSIELATMFYWHGTPETLGGVGGDKPPTGHWTITASEVAADHIRFDGVERRADDRPPRTVAIALTPAADATATGWWAQTHAHGTVTMSAAGEPDQVVEIVGTPDCRGLR